MNSARQSNLGDLLLGCNMTFDRSVFNRVGLFDERLGAGAEIPAGEDTDYIIRCYLAGVELIYDPELVVHHRHGRKTLEDGKALFVGYTIGSGALYAKHAFKDVNLLRPVYWDFKNLVGDMIRKKNSFAPEAGFSYLDKFYYYAVGAGRYFFGGIKTPARASGRNAQH
jgi:GT2 family glycosyltransferase